MPFLFHPFFWGGYFSAKNHNTQPTPPVSTSPFASCRIDNPSLSWQIGSSVCRQNSPFRYNKHRTSIGFLWSFRSHFWLQGVFKTWGLLSQGSGKAERIFVRNASFWNLHSKLNESHTVGPVLGCRKQVWKSKFAWTCPTEKIQREEGKCCQEDREGKGRPSNSPLGFGEGTLRQKAHLPAHWRLDVLLSVVTLPRFYTSGRCVQETPHGGIWELQLWCNLLHVPTGPRPEDNAETPPISLSLLTAQGWACLEGSFLPSPVVHVHWTFWLTPNILRCWGEGVTSCWCGVTASILTAWKVLVEDLGTPWFWTSSSSFWESSRRALWLLESLRLDKTPLEVSLALRVANEHGQIRKWDLFPGKEVSFLKFSRRFSLQKDMSWEQNLGSPVLRALHSSFLKT